MAASRDAIAAYRLSPISATWRAAIAVLKYGVVTQSGCSPRNLGHWAKPCSWLNTCVISETFAPGTPSRQCSTRTSCSPTMWQAYLPSRSYTSLIEPEEEFSTGTTPYRALPSATAAKTSSNVLKLTRSQSSPKKPTTAHSLYAPGTPL